MPKSAHYTLIWSEALQHYELYAEGRLLLQAQGSAWADWLAAHTAFAFQGQQDRRFNLLKERRKQDGEGYWYAYQRQGKQTVKRYVGKSAEVVPARLEEIARSFQAVSPALPLLIPKLQPPRPAVALVRRERLLAALDDGRQRSLILLSAPAGSGKTTLLAQWIATRRTEEERFPPVAWVTLDKSDNDPVRFWRYVITACQAFASAGAQQALLHLATVATFPPAPDQLKATLAHFLNDLSRSACQGLLVLDDYQVITSAQLHQTLAFFVEHLPPSIHLVLLTRGGPAFPVARLRARGSLCEIGADELRFSREETQTFLRQHVPWLDSPALIEHIHALLEGWATGLRLFALSLQGKRAEAQLHRHLAAFASKHRPLHDYFLEEVLASLNPSQQEFLLRTSLLPRLNSALCDALMGKEESVDLLRALEQAGLFLERLDGPGEWFRYQTLFAEAMRAEARRRLDARTLAALLLQAAHWYEREGLLAEAIELALQAQEIRHALALIERYLAQDGFDELREFATLRRWLEPVPSPLLSRHPLLCLYKAQVLSLNFVQEQLPAGTLALINELLALAQARWQAEENAARLGEVDAFRAYLAQRQGLQEEVCRFARQALSRLPPPALHWRGVCLNLLGSNALSRGQVSEAGALLQTALEIWQTLRHAHGARSCTLLLATVYFEQGRLRLASACYQRVVEEAREVGDREDLVPALLGVARLAYEWNDLETAEQAAQEARELSEQVGYQVLLVHSTLLLLQIWTLQGQKLLVDHHFTSLLAHFHAQPWLAAWIQLHQLSYWLQQGDVMTVQHALTTWTLPVAEEADLQAMHRLLHIRADLALHQYPRALASLEYLQQEVHKNGQARMSLLCQVLRARLLQAQGQTQEAALGLEKALVIAHPEGYLRTFLDEGREIILLLQARQTRQRDAPLQAYLQTLLRASGATQAGAYRPADGLPSLSRQEQRVLRLLLAELSYPEMARELTVSLNTIKTQVNSIYRKLNVHSRREARAAVRELRLFATER